MARGATARALERDAAQAVDPNHPDGADPVEGEAAASEETQPKAKAAKPKTLRPCGDGCGGMVASRFLPGHDAKLKSRLIKEALEYEAANEGAADSEAHSQLGELRWTSHLDASRASRGAKTMAKAKRAEEAAKRKAAKADKAAEVQAHLDAKKVAKGWVGKAVTFHHFALDQDIFATVDAVERVDDRDTTSPYQALVSWSDPNSGDDYQEKVLISDLKEA